MGSVRQLNGCPYEGEEKDLCGRPERVKGSAEASGSRRIQVTRHQGGGHDGNESGESDRSSQGILQGIEQGTGGQKHDQPGDHRRPDSVKHMDKENSQKDSAQDPQDNGGGNPQQHLPVKAALAGHGGEDAEEQCV